MPCPITEVSNTKPNFTGGPRVHQPIYKTENLTSIVIVALALLLQQEDRSLLLSQNKDVRKRLAFPDAKKWEISNSRRALYVQALKSGAFSIFLYLLLDQHNRSNRNYFLWLSGVLETLAIFLDKS